MSFGFSVSEFLTLIDLAHKTYNRCRSAPAEFAEAGRQVESLHTILQGLQHEFESPTSLLRQLHKEDFIIIIKNCRKPVLRLKQMLSKYGSLGTSKPTLWNRLLLPVRELREIQTSITLHSSTLSAFLNTIGLGSYGRVEDQLQMLNGRLRGVDHKAESGFRDMLEAINNVGADIRAGRNEGTILTAYSNDKAEVWRQFRKELLSEGFTSASIKRHKHALKGYIRQLNDQGLLDETSPDEESLPQKDSRTLEDEGIDETSSKFPLGENANNEVSRLQRTPAANRAFVAEAGNGKGLAADRGDSDADEVVLGKADSDYESDDLAEVPSPDYLFPDGLYGRHPEQLTTQSHQTDRKIVPDALRATKPDLVAPRYRPPPFLGEDVSDVVTLPHSFGITDVMALPRCFNYLFNDNLTETDIWQEGEWYAGFYSTPLVLSLCPFR